MFYTPRDLLLSFEDEFFLAEGRCESSCEESVSLGSFCACDGVEDASFCCIEGGGGEFEVLVDHASEVHIVLGVDGLGGFEEEGIVFDISEDVVAHHAESHEHGGGGVSDDTEGGDIEDFEEVFFYFLGLEL